MNINLHSREMDKFNNIVHGLYNYANWIYKLIDYS